MAGLTPLPVEDSAILACVADIYARYRALDSGNVADYIPQLAKVYPDYFGICMATADE